MATITATEFKAIINDGDITATNTEYILDLAIDTLNTFDADLPNMSGTAGSKTWSGESKEKGAIYQTARAIYQSFYKGIDPATFPGMTVSPIDVMSNGEVIKLIQTLAQQLTEMEVSRA